MDSIYKENMKYLKDKFKDIYKLMNEMESKETGVETDRIEIAQTREGLLNFRIKEENTQYYLHSQYDPLKEGFKIINNLNLTDHDSLFILGFGLGYHIHNIISSFPQKNKIIIEPDKEIFYNAIHYVDIIDILEKPNVFLYVGKTEAEVAERIQALYDYKMIYYIIFIELPSYMHKYEEYWNEVHQLYSKFITFVMVNINTINLFRDLWVENFFKSMVELPNEANVNCFLNKFKDVPAIIMASGPSLAKNIDLVKGLENKAVLLAAGSAITAIEIHDIAPHFMISIDGLPLMSEIYNAVKCKEIVFAHTLTTHYDCVKKYNGPKMYMKSSMEGTLQLLEEKSGVRSQQVQTGGSCANIALDFARILGCSPIILIGQDLAYTNLVSHTDGIVHKEEIKSTDTKGMVEMEDMFGQKIYTNKSLLHMKAWFESYMVAYKDIKVINATEGGLSIKGSKEMPLQEVIDLYCKADNNIKQRVKENFETSFLDGENTFTHENLLSFLEYLEKGLDKLELASGQRIKRVKSLYTRVKDGKMSDLSRIRLLMDKKTQYIERNKIYRYFIYKLVEDLNYIEKNTVEQEANKEKEVGKKLLVLYKGLTTQFINAHSVISKMKSCIESTRAEIKGKMNESLKE